MKLYTYQLAPSPQRVHYFMKEKGIEDIPFEEVDLMTAAQLSDDYKKVNPRCTVPALALDDGTVISEVIAICRYLEESYPETPLFGKDPKEKGIVCEWDHRIEAELLAAIADTLRNGNKAFKGRALPGALDLDQIPELVERGKARIAAFFEILDAQLANNKYVAGDSFSVADITAFVGVSFSGWVKMNVPENLTNLLRWQQEMAERPCFRNE